MTNINTAMKPGMNVLRCRQCEMANKRRKKPIVPGFYKVPITLVEYHEARVFDKKVRGNEKFSCGHEQSFVIYPLMAR